MKLVENLFIIISLLSTQFVIAESGLVFPRSQPSKSSKNAVAVRRRRLLGLLAVGDSAVQEASVPVNSSVTGTTSVAQKLALLRLWVAYWNEQMVKLWSLLFTSRRVAAEAVSGTLNDHIECDVGLLKLADWKTKMINQTLAANCLHNVVLQKKALASDMPITPHLIYRYLASVDWSDKYNGKKIEDAVASTIEWRENFGITNINTNEFSHMVKNGLGYVSTNLDQHGRSIVYVKVGRNVKMESNSLYQKLLMYTVERADRLSVERGTGEFVTIIDLDGFSFANSLPIPTVKECLNLLKHHYPYRLGGVFIINGSPAFNLMWSMLKPILPRRALGKTFVLGRKDASRVMVDKLGRDCIEDAYGGLLKENQITDNVDSYFKGGYWHNKR